MPTRDEQKAATRARILDAATELLVDDGYAALTTVAVQKAAGVSRGALLHHFSTIAELTSALVAHLVAANELAAHRIAARIGPSADPVERALTALYETMTRPQAQAELGLWAAARTDAALAAVLVDAERRAGRDLHRVVDDLFGPEIVAHERYPAIRDVSVTMLRGLVVAQALQGKERTIRRSLSRCVATVRLLVTTSEVTE